MADKGRPLPKFGEWDVNDPSSAEGFTVIFNKARNEKKTGGKIESPGANDPACKQEAVAAKPPVSNNPGKNGYAAYKLLMQTKEIALTLLRVYYNISTKSPLPTFKTIQKTGARIGSYDGS